MTIYYQHIGEILWKRDAPRSIGTKANGVVRFFLHDIERFCSDLTPFERDQIRETIQKTASDGFQIWGIPSGAKVILKNMSKGDFLLLLESMNFRYAGEVLVRISQPLHLFSKHIWGEERFPIIIFLRGQMITYGWDQFKEHFGYSKSYRMRGQTALVADERVAASPSKSERAFIAHVLASSVPSARG